MQLVVRPVQGIPINLGVRSPVKGQLTNEPSRGIQVQKYSSFLPQRPGFSQQSQPANRDNQVQHQLYYDQQLGGIRHNLDLLANPRPFTTLNPKDNNGFVHFNTSNPEKGRPPNMVNVPWSSQQVPYEQSLTPPRWYVDKIRQQTVADKGPNKAAPAPADATSDAKITPKSNGVMGFLHRAVNTINNDVVKPVQRDIVAPISKGYTAAATAINPQHGLPESIAIPDGGKPFKIPYAQRHQYIGYAPGEEDYNKLNYGTLRPQPSLPNRLLGTFNRDIAQPVIRGVERKPAPVTAETYTQHILDIATKDFGLTPQFKKDIQAQNPRVIDASNPWEQTMPGDSGVSKDGFAGAYNPDSRFKNAPNIVLDKNAGVLSGNASKAEKAAFHEHALAAALVHEGLHSEWDKLTAKQKAQFAETIQKILPPITPPKYIHIPTQTEPVAEYHQNDTRSWLNNMIGSGYEFKPGSLDNFKNIPALPEHAINEAHSYLPAQYYGNNYWDVHAPVIPPAIAKQYAAWLYAKLQQAQTVPRHDALSIIKKK